MVSPISVPAHVFGLNDRGRIAPGLRADLILVKGDPSTDVTATRDIVAVWKTGVMADRAAARAVAGSIPVSSTKLSLLCESRMLHPAFGVMRPKELVFILANSARRGIRDPPVVDCIRKLRESDLPPQPFSIPASRAPDDSGCS